MQRSWPTETASGVTATEFYNLISRNREHIAKTFPVTLEGCGSLEKTAIFMEEARKKEAAGAGYYFYVRSTASNELIGYVSIKNIDTKINKCELAYFVDKDYKGKGIISMTVADALTYCFNKIGMNKVTICTSLVNLASQRVAEKNGFLREGLLRDEFRNGEGALEDVVYWGLLRKDHNP